MALDLLGFLSRGLRGDFASRMSGLIGENSEGTQNALDAALPLLLAGAARKASTPEGAADLLGLINRHGTDPAQLANMENLLGKNLGALTSAGSSILTGLFGDRTNSLWGTLGSLAGIRPGSASTLLSTLAPLVFGLLRGHASKEGLGASGLASLLQSQRETLVRRVPETLTSSLGWGAPANWFGPVPVPVVKEPFWRRRWLWLVIVLVATGLLAMLTGCTRQADTANPSTATAAAPAAAQRPAPGMVKLYFEEGSATPAVDAARQLGEVIAYAKANPAARVSVSGYNDPGGDAAANEEVARNRALAIRNVLVGQGVSENAVDRNKPLATRGGSEGREARRVEVSVR